MALPLPPGLLTRYFFSRFLTNKLFSCLVVFQAVQAGHPGRTFANTRRELKDRCILGNLPPDASMLGDDAWGQSLAESLPCAGVSTPSKGMDAIACAHGQCIWGIESCTAIVVSDSQGSFPQRHQKFLCGEGHACVDCGVSQRSSADSGKSFACVLHLAFIVFPRTTARQMPGNCMASALQLNGNCIAIAW